MALSNFVFIHGAGQGSWVWVETVAAVTAQSDGAAQCLTLDVPGCGTKRGRDTSGIEYDDIARELIEDTEAAGMTDIVLVGHSQAGMLMSRMAGFRPSLFAKLVYVACPALPPGITLTELIGRGRRGERDDQVGWPVDPKTLTRKQRYHLLFCNDMGRSEAEAFLAKLDADIWPVSAYTYRDWRYDHLGGIPSTFVHTLQDVSLPSEWQKRFAADFRVDRTVDIDAGHQVMNTQPQALAEVLLAEAGD